MHTNPLRQYFRRPAVYITLPSKGRGYPDGAIDMPENGELPVYPMTAIDEITAKTPDALYNGNAITELIKSCIPNIKDPWSVSSSDLDAVLVAIKVASNNGEFSTSSQCPSCKEESKYGINLTGVLASLKPGNYEEALQIQDLSIHFRPLEFREINGSNLAQFEIQKELSSLEAVEDLEVRATRGDEIVKKITLLTMDIISKSILFIQTPETMVTQKEFIIEFLQSCDRNQYMKIRDHVTKLRKISEIQPIDIKCIACGFDYKQPFTLNITDFFV